jgi:hypothetical protein
VFIGSVDAVDAVDRGADPVPALDEAAREALDALTVGGGVDVPDAR